MTLPTQVQRQADEAERRLQDMNTPPGNSPGETPPAEPAAAPPAEPAAPTGPTVSQLQEQLAAEQHRYRTLQGMYDADRRRATEQIDNLTAKVEEILTRATPPAAPAQPAAQHSEQDLNDFGAETLDMVRRIAMQVAKEVATGIVEQALAQRLAPVANTVTEVVQKVQRTAEQEYLDALDAQASGWREINVDPKFIQWLSVIDPFAGVARQVLLMDAHQKLESGRVTAIFNQYKADAGIAAPQVNTSQQRPPVDERAAMVEPARTATASRPAGRPQGRTYTRADINKFYRDVTAGRIPAAEAQATEQDILRAQSEGRIVG